MKGASRWLDAEAVTRYMRAAVEYSQERPVLIDHFLENAIEVDVDALCDSKDVIIAGIMQHIEEAGIHSGDSSCVLPAVDIRGETLEILRTYTRKLALALKVVGLVNLQFAIQRDAHGRDNVYVIEVNPRASRTVPFVSKATGVPWAKIAAKVMAGKSLAESTRNRRHFEAAQRRRAEQRSEVIHGAGDGGREGLQTSGGRSRGLRRELVQGLDAGPASDGRSRV